MIAKADLSWSYPRTAHRLKGFGGMCEWEIRIIFLPANMAAVMYGNGSHLLHRVLNSEWRDL
jgi:hypothetical protein